MMNLGQIGDIGLVYDGIPLSDFFIVRGVDMPILPNIETNSLEIDGKPGAWFTSRNIGTRDITVRLALLADDSDRVNAMELLINASDNLAKDKEHRLELGNGFYVNAIMTGSSEWKRFKTWNTSDITFRCFDPFIYGQEWKYELSEGLTKVPIHGKYPTYPVITIEGVEGDFTLEDATAGKMIRILDVAPESTLIIDMAQYKCTANGRYKPCDPNVSDFWAFSPGSEHITISGGTGTVVYTERYL